MGESEPLEYYFPFDLSRVSTAGGPVVCAGDVPDFTMDVGSPPPPSNASSFGSSFLSIPIALAVAFVGLVGMMFLK